MTGPFEVIAGVDQTITPTVQRNGLPYTLFTSANTLSVELWSGENQAVITPGLTAVWNTPSAGTFDLTAPGTSTASLKPGTYFVLVAAAVGTGQRVAWSGTMKLRPSPGSAIPLTTYCTDQDMMEIYPQIDTFINDANMTGFLRERNAAKSDFDLFLIERYDPRPGFNRRRSLVYDQIQGFDIQDSITVPPTPTVIRSSLAAGGLIRLVPDDRIVARICAKLAVAEVLGSKDASDRRSNPFVQASLEFRADAMERMRAYRAFVDTNADGTAEVLIDRDVIFLI
jgi:hypothetical protein